MAADTTSGSGSSEQDYHISQQLDVGIQVVLLLLGQLGLGGIKR
jgi:hypothetical protein